MHLGSTFLRSHMGLGCTHEQKVILPPHQEQSLCKLTGEQCGQGGPRRCMAQSGAEGSEQGHSETVHGTTS